MQRGQRIEANELSSKSMLIIIILIMLMIRLCMKLSTVCITHVIRSIIVDSYRMPMLIPVVLQRRCSSLSRTLKRDVCDAFMGVALGSRVTIVSPPIFRWSSVAGGEGGYVIVANPNAGAQVGRVCVSHFEEPRGSARSRACARQAQGMCNMGRPRTHADGDKVLRHDQLLRWNASLPAGMLGL